MQQLIGREDFESILRSLAEGLVRQADVEIRDHSWQTIVLDVRFDHKGGFIDKIRAATPSDIVSLSMPPSMTLLILSLDSLRRQVTHDRWYGFQLTVNSDKQCDMVYNYDSNCSSDPTFYSD